MNTQRSFPRRNERENVSQEAPPQAAQASVEPLVEQRGYGPYEPNVGTTTSSVRGFTRMNPLEFYGSKVEEDTQEFIDEVYKVLAIMGVTPVEKEELASYQLKGVSKIWFNQWKFFPLEIREGKVPEFINLLQGNTGVKEYALRFTQLLRKGSSNAPPRFNNERVSNHKPQEGKELDTLDLYVMFGTNDSVVYYDASRIGLGCVLMQNGKVIVCASRQLKILEKNNPTHELKLAMVVFTLKIWRHYLYGVHVDVFTDHNSLQYVFNKMDINLRQRRWLELLKDYDMSVLYHPGKENVVANALSWQCLDSTLVELKEMVLRKSDETFSEGGDDVLRYQGPLCVPNVDDLRDQIFSDAHSSRYSIHLGATKMYCDLREIYWWNGMKKDIAEFVVKCPNFQQVKVEHNKPEDFSEDISIPTWKWEEFKKYFIVGLPLTWLQFDSIWIIVDQLTKPAHFIPAKLSCTMEDYAKLYVRKMVRLHGGSLSIISDRGTQFTSHFCKSFRKDLGTHVKLSKSCQPQPDGQVECMIQTLEDMLRAYVINFKGNWDDQLPFNEFANNITITQVLMDHKIRDCPSVAKNEGVNRRWAQPYPSYGPYCSGTNAPKKNKFYALQTSGEQEGSPDVINELDMLDLYVMLGKDWLHSCYVSIDYRTRVVKFRFQNEPIIEGGHIVLSMGIEGDPIKIDVIKSCPRTLSRSEIRSFLGLDGTNDFVVYYDASRIGLGCVLMQNGKVIACASRQLKILEKNYPTHELKLAVVVFTLKIWRHYLYGVHVDVFTDHNSLHYVFNKMDINLRQRRWLELLKDYDMSVLYHPTKANVLANALSWLSMGSVALIEDDRRKFV
ncbi:hypothetical protein MTR67_051678 [Solanum verrucosum]|uniref:Integrase catalytic domain-containing protein n=1 Tax=Solanum verrucosum TaxID=315347 RepID=A0AAF1A2B8_SOLVR|nr:hypothetical protein MTR67_051678 [Solanum verrucosum]